MVAMETKMQKIEKKCLKLFPQKPYALWGSDFIYKY